MSTHKVFSWFAGNGERMNVGIKKAKDQLSRLLHRATLGEEIIITRKSMPVARLIGIDPKPEARKLGIDRGKVWMAEDF